MRLLAFTARESSDAIVLQSTSAEWREESERRGSNADPMCPTLLAPPRDAAEEEAIREAGVFSFSASELSAVLAPRERRAERTAESLTREGGEGAV